MPCGIRSISSQWNTHHNKQWKVKKSVLFLCTVSCNNVVRLLLEQSESQWRSAELCWNWTGNWLRRSAGPISNFLSPAVEIGTLENRVYVVKSSLATLVRTILPIFNLCSVIHLVLLSLATVLSVVWPQAYCAYISFAVIKVSLVRYYKANHTQFSLRCTQSVSLFTL